MAIKRLASDWFSVYHHGNIVGEFGSLAAAERFCRNRGFFPSVVS